MKSLTDPRAAFFFAAAAVCFALVPLAAGYAWVAVAVGVTYVVLGMWSWLDSRAHRRP